MSSFTLFYDGQCGFCKNSLKYVRRADRAARIEFIDSHERERISREFPELAEADFDRAMFVITPARRVFRGFFAFRRLLWILPTYWILIPLSYLPGAGLIGSRVYAWVAENRGRLGSGNSCDF